MARRPDLKKSSREEEDDEEESQEEEEEQAADEGDDGQDEGDSEEAPKVPRARRKEFKAWWRDSRWWLYPVVFFGGFAFFLIGVASVWVQGLFGPWMQDRFREFGGWNTWLLLLSFISFGIGLWLEGGYVAKRREFLHLVKTKSKGDFVRTQDRIERLAFELGTREQDIVASRKREFRIRH